MHKKERAIHCVTFLGTPPFYFLASLPLLIFGFRLVLAYYLAVMATELVCAVIKLLTRTERPIPRKRLTLYDQYDASTFPSAHTARIASNATVVFLFFQGAWLAALGCMLVVLVAYSRVALQHHFVKDVVVGALVGIVISTLIYRSVFTA
ncbi:phosphatase PAP2 family protein [Variovorax sp. RO1]|uniref:phosphatase PAP2 family protein n=1 Tax=Variovorax sp. RO1 TaxID=2066034 RepID=UPI0015DE89BA|nr:phosphatase PAP2 family protein [Variovorax sp. RO1]